MFQSGDVVLYRLVVAQIKQIKQEKKQRFYILHSLESDYCEFKVPYENAFGHIRSLPSKQELYEQLKHMDALTCFEIPRNPGFLYYQNIMDSLQFEDWFRLLKTLYHCRLDAKEKGKKLNQKQGQYYDLVLTKLATIYAFVFSKTMDECKNLLEKGLNQVSLVN